MKNDKQEHPDKHKSKVILLSTYRIASPFKRQNAKERSCLTNLTEEQGEGFDPDPDE